MKLYNGTFSPNALRVRAVAFELGFEPELIEVDVMQGENRTPEYLKLNPNGKVPTLVDSDLPGGTVGAAPGPGVRRIGLPCPRCGRRRRQPQRRPMFASRTLGRCGCPSQAAP